MHDLLSARDSGFLFYFFVLGSVWIVGVCFFLLRAYRRALVTDPITYAGKKPPTLRRMVFAMCWLTIGITFYSYLFFQEYFIGHRPSHAMPSEGRIYPLFVHGYAAYLTRPEHILVASDWMIVFVTCFLVSMSIKMEGDPFVSRLGDVPLGTLPKSMVHPSPAGWMSGIQVLLILGGYSAALMTLMAALIWRAFAAP